MIALRDVSKTFKLYRRPADRLVEWAGLGRRHQTFHALRSINLDVPAGRAVGIVGANGAGKSTLLKLITGTLLPSGGTIEILGRVAALLELGTGFHGEFTGRQNIYINAQLLGLSVERIRDLEEEIIAFSELGAFIDQPLRTYSSGMIVRLGFSIAASVEPEVLIVDEALSVGDARFARKCVERIQEYRQRGTTLLFVSHDPAAVTTLCDEAILLDAGRIVSRGVPRDILEEYNALLASRGSGNVAMRVTRPSGVARRGEPIRHGTFSAIVLELQLCNERGKPSEIFAPGESMRIRLAIHFFSRVENPSVGFLVKDRLGLSLFGTNTALRHVALGPCEQDSTLELEITVPLRLGYGDYHLTVAVHDDVHHLETCYEWVDNAAVFHVRHEGESDWYGVVQLEPEFQTRKLPGNSDLLERALEERFADLPQEFDAALETPCPFLAGFSPARRTDGQPWRQLLGTGLLILKPSSNELLIRMRPASGPKCHPTLLLTTPTGDVVESARDDGETGLMVFHLPAGSVGRMGVFRLAAKDAEASGEVVVHSFICGKTSRE